MKRTTGILALFALVSILGAAECSADTYGRLIHRGNRYFKGGLYGEALDNYIRGEEKNPGVFEPVFNRADALYKGEDYRGAVDAFERSLDFTKRGHEKDDIYYNLGNSLLMVGEYDEAIKNYISGLEINPANLNMKYNLELALERKKAQEKKDGEREEGKGPRDGSGETPAEGDSEDNHPADKNPADRSLADKTPTDKNPTDESPTDSSSRELSKAEAERLLTSVGSEQARIINDIIHERIQGEETDRDW